MVDKILSIIVPSYNMEQYLPKCLGSLIVAPELMERLEVLVVNDGSQDRTSEIAHEFAAKWPETFKVIDKDNGHYGSCVNAALKQATGLFVRMLDADDTYDTNNFGAWLKFVGDHCEDPAFSEVDCFVTDFCTVDANGVKTGNCNYRIAQNRAIGLDEIPRHYLFAMHAVAWRRELLQRINYVQSEGIAYTDTEWATYPMIATRKLYYSPIVVYRYLIEREGQSMDPQVFKKCIGQRVQMFMRMMREAVRLDVSNRAKYRIQYEVRSGINALFLGDVSKSVALANERMSIVDSLVREFGEDVYGEFNCGVIAKWRKSRHLSACAIYLIRGKILVNSCMAPIKKIVKKIIW